MTRILTLVRDLFRCRKGGAAMAMGLAMVPVGLAAGVGVDAGRAYLEKQRLSAALDGATLAAASTQGTEEQRTARFNDYFHANYAGGANPGTQLQPPHVVIDTQTNTLTANVTATVETTFMRLGGFDSITVSASSEVMLASQNVEVALVLDVTGSMAGQRIIDLRAAANDLVDIIVQNQQTPYYSKVALVPYSMAVNVGSYAQQVRGSYTNNTCTHPASPTCRYYKFKRKSDNAWTTHEISTCVTERTGANAFTDVAPSTEAMGRNFPPPGSYNPCLPNTILPLTSDKTTLHDRINALQAGGSTGGHIGVAWGWYMVSPNFGYLWPESSRPAAYGTDKLLKVVIIMTDGEYNSIYFNGVIGKNSTDGSGSDAYKINQNATGGSSYYQSQQLCTAMKAAGVIVYTVGLDVIDTPAARDLVQNCATDAAHVYLPSDGIELKDAFRAIAMKVSSLRLSK